MITQIFSNRNWSKSCYLLYYTFKYLSWTKPGKKSECQILFNIPFAVVCQRPATYLPTIKPVVYVYLSLSQNLLHCVAVTFLTKFYCSNVFTSAFGTISHKKNVYFRALPKLALAARKDERDFFRNKTWRRVANQVHGSFNRKIGRTAGPRRSPLN